MTPETIIRKAVEAIAKRMQERAANGKPELPPARKKPRGRTRRAA